MNLLVTGACGGIGYSVVCAFASAGMNVFATDITERDFPPSVRFFPLDVTSEEQLISLRHTLSSEGVTLDAIVNIAGVFVIDSFIEVDSALLRRVMEVNMLGCMLVNKILYPLLSERGRIIITTSEVAPLDPMPYNGIYGVSKTALDSYAQSLRQELQLNHRKVITVRPGAFDTSLSRASLDKTAALAERTKLYRTQSARFHGIVKFFIGKPSHPDKLAPVYLRAVTSKHPRIIYSKHRNPLLVLMSLLPKRLQCFIIRSLLGKTKSK